MTVCIAAMSGEYIVSASDTLIAGSTLSTDACCTKWDSFAPEWQAMVAGDNISPATPIIENAGEYFKERPNTLKEVRRAFKRAFQNQLSELATDRVLGKLGMDMDDFKKWGKTTFDDVTLAELWRDIRAVRFEGLQFLVWGFDKDRTPHIFTVSEDGEDVILDRPGFGAIGSGGYAADAILYYLNQARSCYFNDTLFNVCAAKFTAERSGAGRDTSLFARKYGTVAFSRNFTLIDNLREAWELYGAPRVPPQAHVAIQRANVKCQTHEENIAEFTKGQLK
jgi:hypothetical protein